MTCCPRFPQHLCLCVCDSILPIIQVMLSLCNIREILWLSERCVCVCASFFSIGITLSVCLFCVWAHACKCVLLDVCASNLPWPKGFLAENSGFGLKATSSPSPVTHWHMCTWHTPSLTLHFKLIIFHPSDKSNKSLQKKNWEEWENGGGTEDA